MRLASRILCSDTPKHHPCQLRGWWVIQALVFSYGPPGAPRHGQQVQVTVEGENAVWGKHGAIDWTTSSPGRISLVPFIGCWKHLGEPCYLALVEGRDVLGSKSHVTENRLYLIISIRIQSHQWILSYLFIKTTTLGVSLSRQPNT